MSSFSLGPAGLVGGQWPSLSTPPGQTGPGGHSCRSPTLAHVALASPTCVNVASISADPAAQREGAAARGRLRRPQDGPCSEPGRGTWGRDRHLLTEPSGMSVPSSGWDGAGEGLCVLAL